MAKIEDIQQG